MGPLEARAARNALAKASSVASRLEDGLVIGADTLVEKDGLVYGKPMNDLEAETMLRALRGSVHRVVTAVAVNDVKTGRVETGIEETRVHVRNLTDEEISMYVATGEPIGKAGGYAIQGIGAVLIDHIEGCFFNIVGLPIPRLSELLKRLGVDIFTLRRQAVGD